MRVDTAAAASSKAGACSAWPRAEGDERVEGGHGIPEAPVDAGLGRVQPGHGRPLLVQVAKWWRIIRLRTPRRRSSGWTPTHVSPAMGTACRPPPGAGMVTVMSKDP